MEKNMELEEALKILKEYLCETHRKFCSIGAVGIPNKEYFAAETLLNHITKQEKMIESMVEWISDRCLYVDYEDNNCEIIQGSCYEWQCGKDCKQCIKQYFENKAEESE